MKSKNIFQTLKIIVLALVFVIGIGYVHAQFQGPSSGPVSGNVDAPVNVGTAPQIKDGNLGVDNFTAFGNALVGQTLGVEGVRGVQVRDNALTTHPYFSKFQLALDGRAVVTGITDSSFYLPLPSEPHSVYDNGWGGPATSATFTCGSLNQFGIPCLVHAPQFTLGPGVDAFYDANSPQYPMSPNQIQAVYSMLYSSLLCADHNGEPILCQELFRDWPFYIEGGSGWH